MQKEKNYTIGHLYVDGKYVCDTIEDKDRGLTQEMPLAEILKQKIMAQTAIPKMPSTAPSARVSLGPKNSEPSSRNPSRAPTRQSAGRP